MTLLTISQAAAENLKPGVERFGHGWKAVLRNEKRKVVWECLHVHPNRDNSTFTSGVSAL